MSNWLSQIELLTIGLLSAFIAFDFYRSKDGRLRVLMIRLFVSKVWVYGGAALFYWLMPYGNIVWARPILIAPMFLVMLQLWSYIRLNNRK